MRRNQMRRNPGFRVVRTLAASGLWILAAMLTACGGGDPTSPGGNGGGGAASVASVEVSPSSGELAALEATLELSASARDADGNTLSGRSFAWSSTDEDVVTVDADGVVTAVANGTAAVEAATDGVSGSASVTVRQVPEEVFVAPPTATLEAPGATRDFGVKSADANGHPVEGATFSWSSSVEAVATVDDAGVATARGEGETKIVVAADPGGAADTAVLTVDLPDAPSVSITSPSDGATYGEQETIAFEGTASDPQDGQLSGADLVWASDLDGQLGTGTSFSRSDLSVGEHTINLTATDAHGNSSTATVIISVEAEPPPDDQPRIAVSQTTATFSATEGGEDPPARTIDVTNGGTGSLTGLEVGVSYASGDAFGWLSASLASSSAPTTLTLDASTGDLAAGSYTATVSVVSDVAENSPVEIPVTFDVAAAASHTLSVDTSDPEMGSVARTPDQSAYTAGSVVSVAAHPEVGHEFVGWVGDATGTENPLSVTMDADVSLTANFRINPPELTASASTTSPFSLTWTMEWPCYDTFGGSCLGSSSDGYVLEESTTSATSGFTTILEVNGARTSPYTTELTRAAGTYHYRVRAVGEGWTGPYSESVTVQVTSGSTVLPAAPSNLAAGVSGTGISLKWADHSGNEDGFELHGASSSSFAAPVDTFKVGPDVTSAELTGPPGTTFYFRVRAYNGAGSSDWSNTVSATTTGDLAVYATADNTVVASSSDPSLRTQVFPGALAVGCDFAIGPYASDYVCRSTLLQFSGLEEQISGQTIASATLRLYPEVLPADFQTTYVVNAIAQPWDPAAVTWENQPLVFTGLQDEQPPPTSLSLPLELDVTGMVQNWADGVWPNHGLLVWDSALSGGFPALSVIRTTYFENLDGYSTPGRRPQLEILFQ